MRFSEDVALYREEVFTAKQLDENRARM